MQTLRQLLKPIEYGLQPKFKDYIHGQADAIQEIERQFNDGKRVVFLDAPTGSGKSLISMVLAHRLDNPDPTALVTVQSIALQNQYAADFPDVVLVKGRGNFECALQPELTADEGLCTLPDFGCEEKYLICPYYIQKAKAAKANLVVTNLAFFLHEANYARGMVCGNRQFLVLDEGHLLENSLMEFVAIQLSERSLRLVGLDLPRFSSPAAAQDWAREVHPLVDAEINKLNVECAGKGQGVDVRLVRELLRYKRMIARLKTLTEITPENWFLAEDSRYRPDGESDFLGYTLKPFYIHDFVEPLVRKHAPRVLLMSATFLNPRVMSKLLGIPYEQVGWHQMDSTFLPERRPYNFIPVVKLSYRTKSVGYQRLTEAIDQILEQHLNQKGVVHTSSYKVMHEILKRTRYYRRFLHHRPASLTVGSNELTRDAAIAEFLATSQPRVLISPAVGLGLDLFDDRARFQIIAKVPFASLADPQVKFRQEQDPEWYSWTAIAGLIQSCGRSTRHVRDYSTCYILDAAFYILWKKYAYLFPAWWKKAFHQVENVEQAVLAVA